MKIAEEIRHVIRIEVRACPVSSKIGEQHEISFSEFNSQGKERLS